LSALPVIAIIGLVITAAWRDLATRTIPNAISAITLTLGVVVRIEAGLTALVLSSAAAFILFSLLLFAYARRLVGGGDVKLMSALAAGLSPLDSYHFVVATAIAGGILAVAYLLLSRRLQAIRKPAGKSLLSRVIAIETWRICRRSPLPYGVAIAVGAAFVLLHPGSF